MRKRITSAFLIFVLLISGIDINVSAVSDMDYGVYQGMDDSNDAKGNVEESYTAADTDKISDTTTTEMSETDTSETISENTSGEGNIEDTKENVPEISDEESGAESDSKPDEESNLESDSESDSNPDSESNSNSDPDSVSETSPSTEEGEGLLEAEVPSNSTTQNFIIDTDSPYDGDYLLVANVSTDADGSSETAGELPEGDIAVYSASGVSAFSSDNPDIYAFDDNGRGIIDPASFLQEPVLDEAGVDYQADVEQAQTDYYIGYKRTFYLNNTAANTVYNPVECVCVAISEYSTVWVPEDDPIYVEDALRMQGYMAELAGEFDAQFPKMMEYFGNKDKVDELYGDNDGKTALLCYDINGNGLVGSSYTAGYFYSADLNINYKNKTNNNIDCLHIDSWHGMNRKTSTNTLDSVYSKRTMVHELQHMINFSICRENEEKFTKLTIPTYLNEAYSEAAAHLCYGAATARITNYNSNSYISGGRTSLLNWDKSNSLSNYALSYLFSQYIRIQYENGEDIYKDTMADLRESNGLLGIIAEKLGVDEGELLLNFRAALFLKNAEGKYGFGGEEWAETIRPNSTSASSSLSLAPGAAVVIPISDSFEPSGAGSNIRFAGMYKELTKDDIKVNITGETEITQELGKVQLSASVFPKGISQAVIFSLPYDADRMHAEVTTDGLVSAVSNGTVTVRGTSVFNPESYTDIQIAISGQDAVIVEYSRALLWNGIRVKYTVTEPAGAVLYYTIDGTEPTQESDTMTDEGLLFDAKGSYELRIWAHDPSGGYRDCRNKENIVVEQAGEPVIDAREADAEDVFAYNITISTSEGETVYYTLDETIPTMQNGIKYEGAFTIDTPGTTILSAVAFKEGRVTGNVVTCKVINNIPLDIRQQSSVELGGIRISYEALNLEDAVFYYTTDGTNPTEESAAIPDEGIFFDTAGTYVLKVLGHDPNEVYRDVSAEDEIVVKQAKEPVIDVRTEVISLGIKRITIQAEEGAAVYYTTDNSVPTVENAVRYEDSFTIDTLGTTTVKAIALKEGMAKSPAASQDVIVEYSYGDMSQSERRPYMTQTSFSLNKKSAQGVVFSILPIMENEIVDANFAYGSGDFLLERQPGKNNWSISLANKNIANKTYQAKIRVISKDADNNAYNDIIDAKIKITDITPKVSLKAVTINTAYPLAGYPVAAASASGGVEILGLSDGNDRGFADNFEIREGALYLKKPYDELVKTASGKPVLSGKINVQVKGYEPQQLNIKVKAVTKAPSLVQGVSPIRLNYNKLCSDKSFEFTLDKKVNAKEKLALTDISAVSLNKKGGKNYEKAVQFLQDGNAFICSDGQHIKVNLKNVKAGTYTLPLSVSAGAGGASFSNASCSVKFIIEKENVLPDFKLSTAKVKLNRQTSGEAAYIDIKSSGQGNMELTGVECKYTAVTSSVNTDNNVSLAYDADTKRLEAKITGEPSCNTYKFECTPVYNGKPETAGGDGAQDNIKGRAASVTISVIDKTPAITVKAKGSIDVLNRGGSAIVYTIKKTNFTDVVTGVEFEEASKLSANVLDARDFFYAPELGGDTAVTVYAKEDAVFIKGMKYAFRLKFELKDNQKLRTIVTKDIVIKPKQSAVKLKTNAKPVFYTYVNKGNNAGEVNLQSSGGLIEKVEWNEDSNKKVPKGITPIIEDGQLKGVTFDGSENIKKGKYKLAFNVYYKGQLWEKAAGGKASYAKPKTFKLTVTVK